MGGRIFFLLPFPSLSLINPPPHLLCSLFCPAAEHGLIWRDHNNSCNSLAFSGALQARPGQARGFSVRLTCWAEGTEILIFCPDSAVPSHDLILAPTSSFSFSLNPTPISDACAHIPAALHARAVKWDTGEERREERSPV